MVVPTDGVVRRVLNDNAGTRIGKRCRAGSVGADEVAAHCVAARVGAENKNAEIGAAGDNIARADSRPANNRLAAAFRFSSLDKNSRVQRRHLE